MKGKGKSKEGGQREDRQNDGHSCVLTQKKEKRLDERTLSTSIRQKQKVKETTADMKFERAKHYSVHADTRLSHIISSGLCELFEGTEDELMNSNNSIHFTEICTFTKKLR